MLRREKSIKRVRLETIAAEKLSQRTLEQIESTEVEVWKEIEPGSYEALKLGNVGLPNPWMQIEIRDDDLCFRVITKIPIKKFLTLAGGFTGLIFGLIKVINWLIPVLDAYYNRAPPIP